MAVDPDEYEWIGERMPYTASLDVEQQRYPYAATAGDPRFAQSAGRLTAA